MRYESNNASDDPSEEESKYVGEHRKTILDCDGCGDNWCERS